MDHPHQGHPGTEHGAAPVTAQGGKPTVHQDLAEELMASTQTLRGRLVARQADLQILSNTRRLLVQRRGIAEAALQRVQAHNDAFQPAEAPLLFDDFHVSSEAGRLTARVQRRMFSAGEAPPAPGLLRFKAHCGICMDALTRMQGASAKPDDSEKNLRVLMDDYRARIAESSGLREEDICWYLVTPVELAPGMPLSFGLRLTTPACVASLVTFYFLIQVQCALLLEEIEAMTVSDVSASPASEAGAAAERRTQHFERGKPPQPHPSGTRGLTSRALRTSLPPPAGSSHASAPDIARYAVPVHNGTGAPGIGRAHSLAQPDIHESTARPPGDCAGAAAGLTQAGMLRVGGRVAATAAAAAGVSGGPEAVAVEGSGESVGSDGGPNPDGGAAGFRRAWYEGTVEDSSAGEEPRLRCGLGGALPLASTVAVLIDATVRQFERRMPRRRIVSVLETMLPALSGGQGGAADAEGGQDGAQRGAGAGAGSDAEVSDRERAAEEITLEDHHLEGLTSATQAMQQALTYTLERLGQGEEPAWQASTAQHEADLQRLQRRMYDFTVGVVGLTACCTQAYLMFCLRFAFPGSPDFCVVENMQVRLYKALRIVQSQRPLLAAVWADWTRNRGALSLSLTESQLPMSIWSPHVTDLPPTLDSLASAVAAHGSTFRLRKLPENSRMPDSPPLGFFAPLMHGDGGASDTAETLPRRRFCAADGRLLLDSPAAWVLSQDLAAAAPGLLGQCPVATIAAAETLRRLCVMKSMSLRVYQDIQSLIVLGDVMTLPQVMRIFWLPMVQGFGCADALALCRLAHQQVHQDELFAKLEALAI